MDLPKYKYIPKNRTDKLEEEKSHLYAKEIKKTAELEISRMETNIYSMQQRLIAFCSEYPVSFNHMCNIMDDIDLTIRRKEQFEKILKEMFPE